MDKEKFLNKNVAIIVLSVALILVSGVAIGLGFSREENGQRNEERQNRFFEMGKQDENQNPNDGENQDGQTNEINQATTTNNVTETPSSTLPTKTPTTTVPTQKTK